MLDELGCRVGLGFVGAIKGKKRPVRKLAGGIIVFGEGELPVKLYGKDRIDDGAGDQVDCGRSHDDGYDDRARRRCDCASDSPTPCLCPGDTALRSDQVKADSDTNEGGNLPSATDVFSTKCHQEEVSFTKVSRADWIRTSDLLTPSPVFRRCRIDTNSGKPFVSRHISEFKSRWDMGENDIDIHGKQYAKTILRMDQAPVVRPVSPGDLQ
jgi:hypothetical protein